MTLEKKREEVDKGRKGSIFFLIPDALHREKSKNIQEASKP